MFNRSVRAQRKLGVNAVSAMRRKMLLRATVVAMVAGVGSAQAANTSLFWDADGATTTAVGGTGTWDTTSLLWRLTSSTGALQAYPAAGTTGGTTTVKLDAATVQNSITLASGTTLEVNCIVFGGTLPSVINAATGATLVLKAGTGADFSTPKIAVNGTNTHTINAVLAGTQGLLISSDSTGTLVLEGANTFTGTTTVSSGTLRTSGAAGALASTTLAVRTGATLIVDNTTAAGGNNSARLADGATLQLDGGTFTYKGTNAAADSLEVIGAVTGTGGGQLTITGGGGNTWLTVASVGHSAGNGSLLINGAGLGASSTSTVKLIATAAPTTVGATAALDTGINAGVYDTAIVPHLVGEATVTTGGVGTATGTANTFLTYNANTGLRPMNLADEFSPAITSGKNTYLTSAASVAASVAVNSLIVSGATVSIDDGQTLTNTSGALLFSGTGAINPTGSTGALTLGAEGLVTVNTGVTGTINAAITGSNGLTLSGAGTLVLGSPNTYTGTTTVNSGTLKVASSFAVSALTINAGTVSIDDTKTLTNTSGVLRFSGNGSINPTGSTGAYTSGADGAVTVDSGVTGTINATISGGNGLSLTGPGILVLAGASTYTGTTTVNSGTLKAGVASVANVSGPFGNNSAVTLVDASGAKLDITGFNVQLGSLSGGGSTGGNVTLGAAALSVGADNTSTTYAGAFSGTGAVTKIGSGTLTLSGNSSHTGITNVSAGTVKLGATGAGANGPLGATGGGTVVSTGATLDLNGFALATAEGLTLNGSGISGSGALTNTSATAVTYSGLLKLGSASTIVANNGDIVFSNTGNITGATFGLTLDGTSTGSSLASKIGTTTGSLTKNGAGTWTLSGASSYTGATTINAGVLKAGVATSALGVGSAVTLANVSGATLDLNGFSNAIGSLSGGGANGGNVTLGSGTLTVGSDNTNTSYAGVISGTGGLTKLGTGNQTLTTAQAYTGTTTIQKGTLIAAVTNGALGDSTTPIALAPVSAGNDFPVLSLVADTATPATPIIMGSTNNPNGYSVSVTSNTTGTINVDHLSTGSGNTIQINNLTIPTLNATRRFTFTGGNGYKLLVAGNVTFSNSATTLNPTTTSVTLPNVAAGSAHTLTLDGTSTGNSITGVISGNELYKTNTSTWTLSGTNTYTGWTYIYNGTLIVTSDSPSGSPGALGNPTGNSIRFGDSSNTVTENAYLLTGGPVTIARPLVAVGGNSGLSTIGGNTDNTSTFSGTIYAQKNLTISQAATTGSNALVISGLLTNNAAGTRTITFAGPGATRVTTNGISGNTSFILAVTVSGGTLSMEVGNTYVGATRLNGGVVKLGVAETAGTSGPLGKSLAANPGSIILGGGTMQYSLVNATDYSGRFSTADNQQYNVDTNARNVIFATALSSSGGSLSLNDTAASKGSLTLSNTNTYSGATTVTAGALYVTGRIDSTSGLTVGSGATAAFTNGLSNAAAAVSNAGSLALNAASTISSLSDPAGLVSASYTGTTTVGANLDTDYIRQSGLSITGGTTTIRESSGTLASGWPGGDNSKVSVLKTLALSGGAKLDLFNNDLVIDYAAGFSPYGAIETAVAAGYNGGAWNGPGIVSSDAAALNYFTLLVLDRTSGGTFDGVTLDSDAVIVKFTHQDDLNGDGLVNAIDKGIFTSHWVENGTGATHRYGDMDFDGIYTANDVQLFNLYYNTTLPSLPEPGSLALLAIGAAGLLARKRR